MYLSEQKNKTSRHNSISSYFYGVMQEISVVKEFIYYVYVR